MSTRSLVQPNPAAAMPSSRPEQSGLYQLTSSPALRVWRSGKSLKRGRSLSGDADSIPEYPNAIAYTHSAEVSMAEQEGPTQSVRGSVHSGRRFSSLARDTAASSKKRRFVYLPPISDGYHEIDFEDATNVVLTSLKDYFREVPRSDLFTHAATVIFPTGVPDNVMGDKPVSLKKSTKGRRRILLPLNLLQQIGRGPAFIGHSATERGSQRQYLHVVNANASFGWSRSAVPVTVDTASSKQRTIAPEGIWVDPVTFRFSVVSTTDGERLASTCQGSFSPKVSSEDQLAILNKDLDGWVMEAECCEDLGIGRLGREGMEGESWTKEDAQSFTLGIIGTRYVSPDAQSKTISPNKVLEDDRKDSSFTVLDHRGEVVAVGFPVRTNKGAKSLQWRPKANGRWTSWRYLYVDGAVPPSEFGMFRNINWSSGAGPVKKTSTREDYQVARGVIVDPHNGEFMLTSTLKIQSIAEKFKARVIPGFTPCAWRALESTPLSEWRMTFNPPAAIINRSPSHVGSDAGETKKTGCHLTTDPPESDQLWTGLDGSFRLPPEFDIVPPDDRRSAQVMAGADEEIPWMEIVDFDP